MGYLEEKIEFLVRSARSYCGTAATDFETRQTIAKDILDLTGKLFALRDWALLKKAGLLLSVFPLLKKDAEGVFLQKIKDMEDACLSIQIALNKAKRDGG